MFSPKVTNRFNNNSSPPSSRTRFANSRRLIIEGGNSSHVTHQLLALANKKEFDPFFNFHKTVVNFKRRVLDARNFATTQQLLQALIVLLCLIFTFVYIRPLFESTKPQYLVNKENGELVQTNGPLGSLGFGSTNNNKNVENGGSGAIVKTLEDINKMKEQIEELKKQSDMFNSRLSSLVSGSESQRSEIQMLQRTLNQTSDDLRGKIGQLMRSLDDLLSSARQSATGQEPIPYMSSLDPSETLHIRKEERQSSQIQPPYDTLIDYAQASLNSFIEPHHSVKGLDNRNWRDLLISGLNSLSSKRFRHLLAPVSRPQDIIIDGPKSLAGGYLLGEDRRPGDCFSFVGGAGNITIRLPAVINIHDVQVDHIASHLNPNIGSAPRQFKVFVDLEKDNDNIINNNNSNNNNIGIQIGEPSDGADVSDGRNVVKGFAEFLLSFHTYVSKPPNDFVGEFTYKYPNDVNTVSYNFHQKFLLDDGNRFGGKQIKSRRIRFEFLNNYGGDYTCIYRLRVHGSRV